ncbi:MAG: sigma-70 family RNA polymerase sigma factor [Acidimicrobiales bacterium]|nr:sigma-70 family RNA polymerase sigma factor [Acidimicrobiales bacterium]
MPLPTSPSLALAEQAGSSVRGLIEACRRGDADAWDQLVERYERLVYGIARNEGLSANDAADVTQASFEVLLDRLHDLREPERLAWWLMTVTRRAAWRVRDRMRSEAPIDPADPDAVLQRTSHDHQDAAIDTLWLYEAMQELGDPCRSLLRALYLDPRSPSYAEVAIRLGRPIGSIGPTRARCIDRLRGLLTDVS